MKLNSFKKIGNLSAMLFVVAATVGAGIFFKEGELNSLAQGDVRFVMMAWGIGIIGILFLGIALYEVASPQKTNSGTMEWTRTFTPHWFHHSVSKFNKWVFNPLWLFGMCVYIVKTFMDSGLPIKNSFLVMLLAFAIFLFFMLINIWSLRATIVGMWIMKGIQLIPMILVPTIAFIWKSRGWASEDTVAATAGIAGTSKWMVLIAGFPTLSFAFDGFFLSSSIRNDFKHPERSNKYMLFGLVIVVGIYVALSFGLQTQTSTGTILGVKWDRNPQLKSAMFACVAIGMSSVVSAVITSAVKQYSSQMDENEMPEAYTFYNLLFEKKILGKIGSKLTREVKRYVSNWVFLFVTVIFHFFITGVVGSLLYNEMSVSYLNYGSSGYLFSFVDLVLSFNSIIYFTILATAIVGAVRNRKFKMVQVTKVPGFKFFAYVSVSLIYASFGYLIISSFIDMFGVNGANVWDAALKLLFIVISISTMFIATAIELKTGFLDEDGYRKTYTKIAIDKMETDDLAALELRIDRVKTELLRGRMSQHEYDLLVQKIEREIYKKGK